MATPLVYVITGASRGIGAEFVKQALQKPGTVVIAGARDPSKSKALQALKEQFPKTLHLVTWEVTSKASLQAAVTYVASIEGLTGVDFLINNAAIAGIAQNRNEDVEEFRNMLETNVLAVHSTIQAFLPLLQSGHKKTVLSITSAAGSMGIWAQQLSAPGDMAVFMPRMLGYKASKAALNMVNLSWASDVTAAEGFTFLAIHPGTVLTDSAISAMTKMGIPDVEAIGALTPAQSVEQMMKTVSTMSPKDSGRFVSADGSTLPF